MVDGKRAIEVELQVRQDPLGRGLEGSARPGLEAEADDGKRASSAIEVAFQVRKDPLGGGLGGSARGGLEAEADSIAQGPRMQ